METEVLFVAVGIFCILCVGVSQDWTAGRGAYISCEAPRTATLAECRELLFSRDAQFDVLLFFAVGF